MTLNTALATASAMVAVAFGFSTLDRWLRRRRPHELAWTVAMGLFALAALTLAWAETRGWSSTSFRLFFLVGAVINVPWLGLGTVYLLAGPRIGRITSQFLLIFTGFALGTIVMAPMKAAVPAHEFPTGKDLFGVLPRLLAALGSAIPAMVIFLGAAFSAWRVLRGGIPTLTSAASRIVTSARQLALGNILIAAGAAVLSASGALSGRVGADRSFVITLLLGIVVLFAGFLVASNATRKR